MSGLIFLRSYLIIVVLIISVGWGLDRLLSHSDIEKSIEGDSIEVKASFLYIDTILKQHKQDLSTVWEEQKKIIKTALGYPVALFQISDFSGEEQVIKLLESGEIVTLSTEINTHIYYQKLHNSDFIIALGPLNNTSGKQTTDSLLIGIYYLLVAVALYVWLWPFSRDLRELQKTAIDFGAENFAARVNVSKNSSITSVATAFNSMAQRIQNLITAHQDLTHAVSHELKTPLSRFKFSLEIINDNDDREQRQQYLHEMKQDVRELDELIDEMLSYAKLGAHNLKLNLQQLDPERWLKGIINQYQTEKIKISLDMTSQISEQEKQITIDKHLMSRAVHNLIRNGLRYAQRQLKISFNKDNKQVYLKIEDDGLGIPEQFREQIFQPFSRLDSSRDRQSGGYGLGLAITQKIVQQHGGKIYVDKSILGGACFNLNWLDIDNGKL